MINFDFFEGKNKIESFNKEIIRMLPYSNAYKQTKKKTKYFQDLWF